MSALDLFRYAFEELFDKARKKIGIETSDERKSRIYNSIKDKVSAKIRHRKELMSKCKCLDKKIQCPHCNHPISDNNDFQYTADLHKMAYYYVYLSRKGEIEYEWSDESDGCEENGSLKCTHCDTEIKDLEWVKNVLTYLKNEEDLEHKEYEKAGLK